MGKLKIETADNNVKIYTSANEVEVLGKGDVRYKCTGSEVTFIKSNEELPILKCQINQVEVDGVPLTKANVHDILSVLFQPIAGGGGGTGTTSYPLVLR